MDYVPRVVDQQLDHMLAGLPAIALEGPRAVGKTATGQRRAATFVALDDPAQLTLAQSKWGWIGEQSKPVFVDEWQLYPSVWDQIRRAVDNGTEAGSFILAGSASPQVAPQHSGAGRIVRLRMRPLSLAERGLEVPTVSLGELLRGGRPTVSGNTTISVNEYANEIVSSGFPGIRSLPEPYRTEALTGYLDVVVERDFPDSGHMVRRPNSLRSWLAAYAAASSSTASYSTILNAASAGDSDKPSRSATEAYRETLTRMWLLDEVPAWAGPRRHMASLGSAPKHQLADPALAANLLGAGAESLVSRPNPTGNPLVRNGVLLGALFESLVTLSVRVYAANERARVSHMRTSRGDHEVDLIVERADGRVLALEVKLAPNVTTTDVKNLLWLQDKLGDDLIDAMVITTGHGAYRRSDGIAVIPAALLGA